MRNSSVGDAAIAVVRRNAEEVQGKGNWGLFEELFADDFVDHTPQPGTTPDKDGARALVAVSGSERENLDQPTTTRHPPRSLLLTDPARFCGSVSPCSCPTQPPGSNVTLKAHGLDVNLFVAPRPGGWHQPQALVDAAHQVCPYSHATSTSRSTLSEPKMKRGEWR